MITTRKHGNGSQRNRTVFVLGVAAWVGLAGGIVVDDSGLLDAVGLPRPVPANADAPYTCAPACALAEWSTVLAGALVGLDVCFTLPVDD